MKAVVWHRPRKVSVDEVPDPRDRATERYRHPGDGYRRYGSDLHLFDHSLTMMMKPGDIAGGQAEYLRVPQAQVGPIKIDDWGVPERAALLLSDPGVLKVVLRHDRLGPRDRCGGKP
jgi:hypothetical protein